MTVKLGILEVFDFKSEISFFTSFTPFIVVVMGGVPRPPPPPIPESRIQFQKSMVLCKDFSVDYYFCIGVYLKEHNHNKNAHM